MARAPKAASTDTERALAAATIEELIGAALVLDAQLRVRIATGAARSVLGFDAPIGTSATTLLCGDRPKRPFAEALAEGIPFQAVIPRPRSTAGERVRVRSLPINNGPGVAGWIIYLSTVAGDEQEAVEFHGMWTRDGRMKEMFRIVEKVAAEEMPVLIRGETGTGKELVAHALHALSPRRRARFVRSIVPRYQRHCSRASCSATCAERSPALGSGNYFHRSLIGILIGIWLRNSKPPLRSGDPRDSRAGPATASRPQATNFLACRSTSGFAIKRASATSVAVGKIDHALSEPSLRLAPRAVGARLVHVLSSCSQTVTRTAGASGVLAGLPVAMPSAVDSGRDDDGEQI